MRPDSFPLATNAASCFPRQLFVRRSSMAKSFSKIKGLLIDLSGTLHIEDIALPGAVDAVGRLNKSGLKIKFATNTTKESQNCLYRTLTDLGFELKEEDIFTSLIAAREIIKQKCLKPYCLLEESALEDFKGVVDVETNPNDSDSVVVGLAPNLFDYDHMNAAFKILLKNPNLIAIHKSRYYKRKDGLALGPGPFVAALEFATDVQATVVGKPEVAFFKKAYESFKCEPEEVAMIGDDVCGDVEGAQKAGMIGILVRTGKYKSGDENKIFPPPDLVCDNFAQAVEAIFNLRESA